jgi:UDP-glucuronate 4-epimerase
MADVLITGGAGFIGSHLVDRLVERGGHRITVLDNFEPFYDPREKEANAAAWTGAANVQLVRADLRDLTAVREAVTQPPDVIVHLAARAGVRPSLEDPVGYQQVNVMGTQNLLELARVWGTRQFVFASSSSVYGTDPNVPWREDHAVLRPVSPYASTKVSGELLGHVYSHLYDMRFVALRFFTVYGPRQRPDLAIRKFAERMLRGEAIPVFGDGSTRRDYTFVEDTVDGILAAMAYEGDPYAVFNLGNDRTVTLARMIEVLEEALGVQAVVDRHGAQPGDVPQTWADLTHAKAKLGYDPQVPFEEGVARFVRWLELR